MTQTFVSILLRLLCTYDSGSCVHMILVVVSLWLELFCPYDSGCCVPMTQAVVSIWLKLLRPYDSGFCVPITQVVIFRCIPLVWPYWYRAAVPSVCNHDPQGLAAGARAMKTTLSGQSNYWAGNVLLSWARLYPYYRKEECFISMNIVTLTFLAKAIVPMHANHIFNFFLIFHLASSITLSFNPNSSILVINITKGSTWFLSSFVFFSVNKCIKWLSCSIFS